MHGAPLAESTGQRPLLLVCDLDRTLIPNGPQPEDPDALGRLRDLACAPGVHLAFATGRDAARVRRAMSEWNLPAPGYVIADVGATVYRVDGDDWHADAAWTETLSQEWRDENGLDLLTYIGDLPGARPQEANRMSRFKCSYYVDIDHEEDAQLAARHRLISLGLSSRLIWSVDVERDTGLLDILPASASKLGGLRVVQRNLGVSDDDTVFAGDSGNDLEVLTSGVPSILVGNAEPQVVARARRLARQKRTLRSLYIASEHGDGANYAAGVLAGLTHHRPDRPVPRGTS